MIIDKETKPKRFEQFTIGHTPSGEAIFVAVDTAWTSGMAYDLNGYSYQWEDGFLTWKSEEPNEQDAKDVHEAYKDVVEFLTLKTNTKYIC